MVTLQNSLSESQNRTGSITYSWLCVKYLLPIISIMLVLFTYYHAWQNWSYDTLHAPLTIMWMNEIFQC